MVLCLLPCYHFFIYSPPASSQKKGELFLLRMGSMIAIEFRLSIFVMKIYVASKLDEVLLFLLSDGWWTLSKYREMLRLEESLLPIEDCIVNKVLVSRLFKSDYDAHHRGQRALS